MTAETRLSGAVRRACADPETVQGALLVFVLLAVGLWALWPQNPEAANQSWYGLAALRAGALAAWAVLAGARDGGRSGRVPLPTILAMLLVALLTSPIELAAHAASAPARSVVWSLLATPLLTVVAYGIGAAVSRLALRARVPALVPLLVPAAVAGILYLDVRLGTTWLAPWLLPGTPSSGGAVPLAVGAALVILAAWRAWRRATGRAEALA